MFFRTKFGPFGLILFVLTQQEIKGLNRNWQQIRSWQENKHKTH